MVEFSFDVRKKISSTYSLTQYGCPRQKQSILHPKSTKFENIGMIGMCFLHPQNFVDLNVIYFVLVWGSIGRVFPKRRIGFLYLMNNKT
jgi:hypothetical protein